MDPISPYQPLEISASSSSFEEGIKIGGVQALPMDALIGGLYVIYVGYYIKKFIDSFRDNQSQVTTTVYRMPTLRERVVQRIIYTAQAISASMLFVDWGLNKGWFVLESTAKTILKVVAHSMSLIFWGYKCIESIYHLIELPRLIEKCDRHHLYQKKELQPEIYAEWISLFSNFAFVLASGLQVMAVITGTVIAASTIEFLVMASMALMVAGIVVDILFNSHEKIVAARLLFADTAPGYTQLK